MSSQHRDETVADSLLDALDPLETHRATDPSAPVPLVTQIIRFTLTGVLSAIVDYGLLQGLIHLGLGYTWAKSLSFVAGTLTAYLINRRWTFRAEPSRARFLAVMALYAVMFGVQVGLFSVLVPWFGSLGQSQFRATTLAYVLAQGVATVTNFLVQRTVIFRMT